MTRALTTCFWIKSPRQNDDIISALGKTRADCGQPQRREVTLTRSGGEWNGSMNQVGPNDASIMPLLFKPLETLEVDLPA